MNFQIRVATEADSSILLDLYADMDNTPASPLATWRSLWSNIQGIPDYHFYLVFEDEIPVATFSLLYIPTPMHPGIHRVALVDSVTVKSDRRGQGIGQYMMRWAFEKAAADGCYKMMLSSSLSRDRAHDFYRSLGFDQHGWSFHLQLKPNH